MKQAVKLGVAVAVCAAMAAPALAQRAAEFSAQVRQFVAHDAAVIAVENVRVIDGTGGAARDAQTILIRDGRIDRIDADIQIPTDAERIDGAGMTALPGLVMMHEHLFYRTEEAGVVVYDDLPIVFPRLYLALGATTIRTAGSVEPVHDLQIARRIASGELVGPDVVVTGPYLEGPGSFMTQAEPIDTPEKARRIVSFWSDLGAQSFKSYMFISRASLGAAIDEAHARGRTVTGHLCSVTWSEAIDLGIDNLEHGFIGATDFVGNKQPDRCPMVNYPAYIAGIDVNGREAQALIDKLVRNDVAVTSTLAVLADFGGGLDRPTQAALSIMSDRQQAAYLRLKANSLRMSAAGVNQWDDAVANEMAFEKAFADAGGLLMAGTDPTGIGGAIAGFGSIWQIELLVEAGFTPLEAMAIASRNGAQYLGRLDEIGTLETGKRADIYLVEGRPDETISDLRNPVLTFKDGIAFDSNALIESVRGEIE